MKILVVCGVGMGTSVLLKTNIDRILTELDYEAEVIAAPLAAAEANHDAQLILTTTEYASHFADTVSEVIVIDNLFDLAEIKAKLVAALL
jgi:PTS system ascorbate-specific IIB component